MDEKVAEICAQAVDIYGVEAQTWMAIEEMAELLNALAKHRRNRVSRENICEEIADVSIMMIQLAYIFGVDEVNEFIEEKINRLEKRLAKHVVDNKTNVTEEIPVNTKFYTTST
jgi:NTP pyrophosphatase (non-canonical NTP hydrolase)